ncbi:hypothetical protein NGB36_07520 [Streptomyces sp. RB6PN25]|uniref:Integral membrane protein n=1 Tax=Streptomyces humicola TaxID=2953240 RepID=A0ABT1PV65_9ACTN|nr:hypothetical protein [Streptomyces humicola]MCQ4080452.1 hypothetical protein [Streptomyces humicola]
MRVAADKGAKSAAEPAEPRGTDAAAGRLSRLRRDTRVSWVRANRLWKGVAVAAGLIVVLLALMVIRLPWAGDLGIHAATIERLRHDLGNPGDPLVNADVASPYYSPWMAALAVIGQVTGVSTFGVLHFAALVDLVLLVTGIHHFVRTLTRRRAAVPLAILSMTLLMGWGLFTWSGFPGLTSLALCLAYPSTFALGASLHLWALLRKALTRGWKLPAFLGLGVLLALVMLVHQFTGVVAVCGLLALLLGARPFPALAVWLRVAVAAALALAILLVWPYYSFLSLLGVGGLDSVHKPLYEHLFSHYGLVLVGVVALWMRFRRDRRDPLVLLFALGVLVFAVGGITGHYSYGRILPAVLISAQLALAVECVEAPDRDNRAILGTVAGAALLMGCWAQAGTLSYVLPTKSLPVIGKAPTQKTWGSFAWVTKHVPYGGVVMTEDYFPLRQLPAYGPYTVESGYPDFFLKDTAQRAKDTKAYFSPTTTREERLALLHAYHVGWVLQTAHDGGLSEHDPALQLVEKGPKGELLFKIVR